MRVRMTHRAYKGAANVLPEQQEQWEAAGWAADKPKKKATPKKETEE